MAISNMVSSAAPPLLAIKGQVTVNFVDGQILDGEFKAQDAFNIFLVVSGEPIMIPRTQIRFIKGSHVDQIEVDTSPLGIDRLHPSPYPPRSNLSRLRPKLKKMARSSSLPVGRRKALKMGRWYVPRPYLSRRRFRLTT